MRILLERFTNGGCGGFIGGLGVAGNVTFHMASGL